jgi:hypothetical protein
MINHSRITEYKFKVLHLLFNVLSYSCYYSNFLFLYSPLSKNLKTVQLFFQFLKQLYMINFEYLWFNFIVKRHSNSYFLSKLNSKLYLFIIQYFILRGSIKYCSNQDLPEMIVLKNLASSLSSLFLLHCSLSYLMNCSTFTNSPKELSFLAQNYLL